MPPKCDCHQLICHEHLLVNLKIYSLLKKNSKLGGGVGKKMKHLKKNLRKLLTDSKLGI